MMHIDAPIHCVTAHVSLLESVSNAARMAMELNPCQCHDGLCDHCTRLAWLAVSAKEAHESVVSSLKCKAVTVAA